MLWIIGVLAGHLTNTRTRSSSSGTRTRWRLCVTRSCPPTLLQIFLPPEPVSPILHGALSLFLLFSQAEIPSIAAVVILDSEGKRVVAQYFKSTFASSTEELAFEKKLFDKTMRTNAKSEAEIIILDGLVTVYRNSADIWVYIVGTQTENELILVNVLGALTEALGSLLRSTPDKRLLLDNFDTLLITIDEMLDVGMILETDAGAIVNRVGMKAPDAGVPAEQTVEGSLNTMFASARESIARSILK